VRPSPEQPHVYQLVVLDHGMYRRLSFGFRRGYCELWHALILGDIAAGEAAAVALGMPREDFGHLSLILTFRPAGAGKIGQKMTTAEAKAIRDKYKGVTAQDANDALQRLPRDLLFVLRSMNMVRSLNLVLGGTAAERFLVMGDAAVMGLQLTRNLRSAGLYEPMPVTGAGGGAEVEAGVALATSKEDWPQAADNSLFRILKSLRPHQQSPPLTYAAAQAAGLITTSPTESEMLLSARSSDSAVAAAWHGAWGALQREWGLLSLRWRLSNINVYLQAAEITQTAAAGVRRGLEQLGIVAESPAEIVSEDTAEFQASVAKRERKRAGRLPQNTG
jgi:hypothetical protein